MAAIKKASGIAFSEEIFLSILICLTAKNKHLVLHTTPDAVSELKSIAEQVPWPFFCSGYNPIAYSCLELDLEQVQILLNVVSLIKPIP